MPAEIPKRRRLKTNFEIGAQKSRIIMKFIPRVNGLNKRIEMFNADIKKMWREQKFDLAVINETINNIKSGIPVNHAEKASSLKTIGVMKKRIAFAEKPLNNFDREFNSLFLRTRKAGLEESKIIKLTIGLLLAKLKEDIADEKSVIEAAEKFLRAH
ncbi:MAG: hypothetical protein J4415_02270 [Candidatus Diapherotrites archaeon]|uniref:Uncharacterized protein n=1 Tax=Candidatus Iainarchaeum sp. TaxID=3101447 RepID=A0A8T4KX37_9ARCH|nr:hypothetical protein [Candidatus Diapherotrites archaeon]